MLEMFSPGRSLTWDLVWQSSMFLTMGLAVSLLIRGRPARAHRLLALTIVAAIGTPLLSQAIRRGGWGLLREHQVKATVVGPTISMERTSASPQFARVAQESPSTESPGAALGLGQPHPERVAQAIPNASQAPDENRPVQGLGSGSIITGPSWRQILLGCWMVLSGLVITRFVASFGRGVCLVRRSARAGGSGLNLAVAQAVTRLGLVVRPELRSSPQVRCPSVWCWGRRPVLLVPASAKTNDDAIDWIAVFSHELAHWRRLDHIASLAGELLVCVLPWNPLAWWSRSRLGQFAELACDDWVLASGSVGTDYAASLLELLPQRAPRAHACRRVQSWRTGR